MALSRFHHVIRPSSWALELDEATIAAHGWSNKDMDPVPPHLRTWTTWNYITYWLSDAMAIGIWESAGSMLAIGLSWRQALPCIFIGYCIISIVMLLNGTMGVRLRVAFPVLSRSSFGFWFSYFTIFSRIILAMFWFGIQSYNGSQCVYQMIKAVWPSVTGMPNYLPLRENISSSGLLCYLVYWLIQFPFMLLSPHKLKWLFFCKSIIAPITWLAMIIWAFIQVPPSKGFFTEHAIVSGAQLSWSWLIALNSALGAYAPLSINIPDFTRYAENEKAQFVQPLIIPIAFTLSSFAGIATTSAGIQLYREVLWNPLLLIDKWNNRPAAFFASLFFSLATISTNISANTFSAGNDMTALFPKYINIRRGQIICAVVGGWAFVPWKILASAQGFLNFINGFTVFFGPFAGIMVTDYWLVHKGTVDVPSMYDPYGRYRYIGGFNWRAVLAMLVTVGPTFAGLINTINPAIEVGYIAHLFDIAWIYGFVVASTVYYTTSVLFPAQETFVEKPILADDSVPDRVGGKNTPDAVPDDKGDAAKIGRNEP